MPVPPESMAQQSQPHHSPSQSTIHSHQTSTAASSNPPPTISSSSLNLQPPSSSQTQRSRSPVPHTSTPTPESAQSRAESYLDSSELNTPTRQRRPMMSIHAPPIAAASAALNDHAPLQSQTDQQNQHQQQYQYQQFQGQERQRDRDVGMFTIDRAIAGVFLVLVLMVLKKIFYPAGTNPAPFGYVEGNGRGRGGGAGGFYMEREM